jgi:hypothetical protein
MPARSIWWSKFKNEVSENSVTFIDKDTGMVQPNNGGTVDYVLGTNYKCTTSHVSCVSCANREKSADFQLVGSCISLSQLRQLGDSAMKQGNRTKTKHQKTNLGNSFLLSSHLLLFSVNSFQIDRIALKGIHFAAPLLVPS